ncbi:MAG: class I SAM-dependent rRNA methyltransferase [bacterium]|nr:class I SAM-dependent rRNA methyltransferase [bacterium]
MGKITLSGKGRRWLLSGHPWVYRDDIADGDGTSGELIPVEDPNGNPFGWGLYSGASRIAVRMVTSEPEQPNRAFWAARIQRAVDTRAKLGLLPSSNQSVEGACRLLSGDAEGVPGLVVDRYGGVLVLQCGTQAADRMRDFLVELLREALPFEPLAIIDRSDTSVRRLEKLEQRVEVIDGAIPDELTVREGEIEYAVDVLEGHKTGSYLDQRVNRRRAAQWAEGRTVLDAFSYDGLFGLQAAKAGAERVVCLEQNRAAGERLMANAERNGLAGKISWVRANCMQALRDRAEADERYDLVIVDPPAFARNKREVQGAERGYVELNRRALELLEPGGHLVSASCSYNILANDFVSFLAAASRLAKRAIWLEELAGAAPDHPHLVTLPETHYLKCAFLRAD